MLLIITLANQIPIPQQTQLTLAIHPIVIRLKLPFNTHLPALAIKADPNNLPIANPTKYP